MCLSSGARHLGMDRAIAARAPRGCSGRPVVDGETRRAGPADLGLVFAERRGCRAMTAPEPQVAAFLLTLLLATGGGGASAQERECGERAALRVEVTDESGAVSFAWGRRWCCAGRDVVRRPVRTSTGVGWAVVGVCAPGRTGGGAVGGVRGGIERGGGGVADGRRDAASWAPGVAGIGADGPTRGACVRRGDGRSGSDGGGLSGWSDGGGGERPTGPVSFLGGAGGHTRV